MLGISLVTLTDWVKRGLPRHKQRGRVYFMKSEILDYLKSDAEGKTGKFSKKASYKCCFFMSKTMLFSLEMGIIFAIFAIESSLTSHLKSSN